MNACIEFSPDFISDYEYLYIDKKGIDIGELIGILVDFEIDCYGDINVFNMSCDLGDEHWAQFEIDPEHLTNDSFHKLNDLINEYLKKEKEYFEDVQNNSIMKL